jgi:phage N-6-adenine-methyltransferase
LINKGLMSSNYSDWATPQDLFDELNLEFDFDLDVCASAQNHKCEKYFTEKENGLDQEWRGNCWMNPPYGRTIGFWMKKAYLESLRGATVVCLIPSRTDTAWWHDYAMKGEIRFLKGRVKFLHPSQPKPQSAPFPSAIVIFRGV